MDQQIKTQRLTTLENFRCQSKELIKGPLGQLLARSFEFISTVVRDGLSDASSVVYAIETFAADRELAYKHDANKMDPIRQMIYDVGQAVGMMVQVIKDELSTAPGAAANQQANAQRLEDWRVQSMSKIKGPLGKLFARTFEFVLTVVRDGVGDVASVAYAIEGFSADRNLAYKFDQEKADPLRGLVYGLTASVGTLVESIMDEQSATAAAGPVAASSHVGNATDASREAHHESHITENNLNCAVKEEIITLDDDDEAPPNSTVAQEQRKDQSPPLPSPTMSESCSSYVQHMQKMQLVQSQSASPQSQPAVLKPQLVQQTPPEHSPPTTSQAQKRSASEASSSIVQNPTKRRGRDLTRAKCNSSRDEVVDESGSDEDASPSPATPEAVAAAKAAVARELARRSRSTTSSISSLGSANQGEKKEKGGKLKIRKRLSRNASSREEKPAEEKLEEFPCDQCDSCFSTRREVQLHAKTHHRVSTRRSKRSVWDEDSDIEEDWNKDEARTTRTRTVSVASSLRTAAAPEDVLQFPCGKCERSFHTRNGLSRHSLTHDGVQCDVCKQWIAHDKMENHIMEVHNKGLKCPVCFTLISKDKFDDHMEKQHNKVKRVLSNMSDLDDSCSDAPSPSSSSSDDESGSDKEKEEENSKKQRKAKPFEKVKCQICKMRIALDNVIEHMEEAHPDKPTGKDRNSKKEVEKKAEEKENVPVVIIDSSPTSSSPTAAKRVAPIFTHKKRTSSKSRVASTSLRKVGTPTTSNGRIAPIFTPPNRVATTVTSVAASKTPAAIVKIEDATPAASSSANKPALLKCKHCPRVFDNPAGLSGHIQRMHWGVKCTVCKKPFSEDKIEQHMKKDHSEKAKEVRTDESGSKAN